MKSLIRSFALSSMVNFAAANDAGADPLADLGLDLGADAGTPATEGKVEAAADGDETEKVKQTRKAVEVGETTFETVDLIPGIKRGGGGRSGESKYKFDELEAPVEKADGEGYSYSTFTVLNVEGQELVALQRSVQSAATARNREAKENNSKVRYITRGKVVDGETVGIIVFRVDDTIGDES